MKPNINSSNARLSQITFQMWRILRNPRVVLGLAILLIIESLVALGVPQKPFHLNSPADFVVWVSNLPSFFQQNFQWLDTLNLFRIFQSAWFWFPASLFSLSSLVALADILPATWQRLSKLDNSIQHPLSHIYNENIRLNAPQDAGQSTDTAPIETALNEAIVANGYKLHPSTDKLAMIASRHSWHWSRPVLILAGGLLLLLGTVTQSIWGNSNQVLLSDNTPPVPFINEQIVLANFSPTDIDGTLSGGKLSLLTEYDAPLNLQLGHWTRVNGWWIAPPKAQPSVQISFRQNESGATERLNLTFINPARPLIVAYSPKSISIELRYIIKNHLPDYQLNIVEANNKHTFNVTQTNHAFKVADLNIEGSVSIQDKFALKAYQLPGLIAYVWGVIFLMVGAVLFLLPPPILIHIKIITKGRGSRIEASAEGLAKVEKLQSILSKITKTELEDKIND